MEKYERKKQGRRRRPRKQQEDVKEPNWFSVYKNVIIVTIIVVAILATVIHIALAE